MNCKRQPHHGKYICGLPTVKTCYVFAVLNIIVGSLLTVGLLGWLGLLVVTYGETWNSGVITLVSVVCYLASATSVIFAILLLIGIHKKRPNLVKTYLLYGIILEVLLILAVSTFIVIYNNEIYHGRRRAIYAAVGLCFCILYGIILRMVMHTYIILRNNRSFNAHRTDIQVLFMLGTDGQLQALPLMR